MALTCVAASTQYFTRSVALLTAFPVSFECWYKPSNNTGAQALISIASQTANSYWRLASESGAATARNESAGGGASATSGATLLTVGSWSYLFGVFTSSTSRDVYLNGFKSSNASSIALRSALGFTNIGLNFAGPATASGPANGDIAFPKIWNVALSQTDVNNLYNSGAGKVIVQASNLKSFSLLGESISPWVDYSTGVFWTTVGTPAHAADPFVWTLLSVGAKAGLSPALVTAVLSDTIGAKSGLSAANVTAVLANATVGAKSGLTPGPKLVNPIGTATMGSKSGLSAAKAVMVQSSTVGAKAGLSSAKSSSLISLSTGARAGLNPLPVLTVGGQAVAPPILKDAFFYGGYLYRLS